MNPPELELQDIDPSWLFLVPGLLLFVVFTRGDKSVIHLRKHVTKEPRNGHGPLTPSISTPVSDENPTTHRQAQRESGASQTIAVSVHNGPAVKDEEKGEVPSPSHPHPELPSKAKCIALVATVTGAGFMNTLSIQATVIILPTIGKDLDIPDSRLQWIVSAYALTFGCFLLLWGRIADIYGKRLIFISGSIWVAVVTLVNPFIKNEIGFNLFRGLQGLGAAANVPTAIGILGTTFPPGKAKNYAFSAYAAGAPLGSIFGNLLSGFITAYADWLWVFVAMGILCGIIAAAGFFVIPKPKSTLHDQGVHAKNSVDWLGACLITAGLLALMFALTQGNVVGWSTPWIPALIVVSLILIALFIVWQWWLEKKGKQPLMKVSMFHSTRFSAAMVIMGLFFSSFNNFLVYTTYFYQEYQGYDTLQTTLRFIPTGVVGVITAFVVAQLLSRVPTVMLLIFGMSCVSAANLLFAVPIPPTTSYFAYSLWAMILSVFGADTTWPCLTLFTSASLPHEDQALGGALINAVGQFGRAIGLAIVTAVQTSVMAKERGVSVEHVGQVVQWEEASLKGLRAADWLSFGLGVTALSVVCIFFRGSGIVGKVEKRGRGGGEEAIMNEEDSN
ncbi:hypothetical protein MKZ38_000806 [Zalerion maritima]|uniref:Major facilitator superfamily (MFS) profile domain-containing protein n=1 Tax=Zalerion maritima TaxID=339359 RepID=A0AAD5RQZ5_9PEZI|nr:hypothetical protein MKZ38_000806 [Zalerion maritima]